MTDETRVNGEVVDERTGEIIPIGDIPKPQSNTLATSLDLTRVGTLELDDNAKQVLAEPIKPEDVQIRPDGLVYFPWTWYADRLNRAFGRLGWGLVPQMGAQKVPMGNSELVVWGHWLVVKGVAVGFEYGECSYRPDNFTMSFGDAAAGAKSNSLARNCKMLGMSLELWNQEWVSAWKEKYAERVRNPNGNRPEFIWRKKKSNGKTPAQQAVENTEPAKVELVETVVGYVSKEVWDEHAKRIAEDNDQSKSEPEKLYVSDFRKIAVVKKLARESGKKDSEVVVVINELNPKTSYSFDEVLNLVKGEQDAVKS